MPNFHTNNLVIACRANEMLEVLRLIERNLRATQEMTGYEGNLEDVTDVQAAYEHIWGYIDAYYMEAFSPAPIGSRQEDYQVVDFEVSGLSDLGLQLTMAPSGRGVSETASVEMLSQEDRFLLTVDYSTAWKSNSDEINAFLAELPSGEYGYALLHADESDWYEETWLEYGATTNSEDWESEYEHWDSRKDLARERVVLAEMPMGALTNFGELARACAILYWREFNACLDDIVCEPEFNTVSKGGVSYTHSYFLRSRIIDEAFVRNDLAEELGRFPLFVGISGAAYEDRETSLLSLVPGSEVRLKSDWCSPYFSPVDIEVFDERGRSLGRVDSNDRQGIFIRDETRAILALVLPFARAMVEMVDLKGMGDGRRKHSNIVIRVELDPVSFDDIVAEAKQVVGTTEKHRGRISRIGEEA